MLPLLALIPGLLWTGAKVIGPIIEDHASQITQGILALTSKTPLGKDIAGVFDKVLGGLDQAKKDDLAIQLQSLIDQSDLDKQEAQSTSLFISGWRPMLAWMLGLNIGIHYTLINLIDIINCGLKYAGYDKVANLSPMDPMTLTLMTGLLGLYMGVRTFEKTR